MLRNNSSKVIAIIIMSLTIISIIFTDLLYFEIMKPIVEFINDASGFITIICLSFVVKELLQEQKSYSLIGLYCIDMLLINHLYSNSRWLIIFNYIKNIDKINLLFCVFAVFFMLYLFYRVIKKEKIKFIFL